MRLRIFILTTAFASIWCGAPRAGGIESLITADNHFALFVGDEGGQNLQYIGRNSQGWQSADPLAFDINQGEYVYIAAWDHWGAFGVLGQFVFTTTALDTVFTSADWEVAPVAHDSMENSSPAPTVPELEGMIDSLNSLSAWTDPTSNATNDGGLWAYVPGISTSAGWMWVGEHDSWDDDGQLFLFRTVLYPQTTGTATTSWGDVKKKFR